MKKRHFEVSNWTVIGEIKKINSQDFVQHPQFLKEGNLCLLVSMLADHYVY